MSCLCLVTDSLAAFVTAERLVNQNEAVSESDVEQAMMNAQMQQATINARNNGKGEEHRCHLNDSNLRF